MGVPARPVSFPSDDLILEGLLDLPAMTPCPGIVVCHPHPLYGGDMRNSVVATLCETAVACGVAALRFNFRGVGGSEGSHSGGPGERSDAAGALTYLRGLPEIDAARVALAGYSFGALIALMAADAQLKAVIAVSAPTADDWSSQVSVACPVLFVSGDRDEYCDPEALQHIASAIGPNADLVVMSGADHFWWGAEKRLAQAVSAFLREHLS